MNRDESEVLHVVSTWVDEGAMRDLRARVEKGRATYGGLELDNDGRRYLVEACEELADACFYLACEVSYRRRSYGDGAMVALLGHFTGLVWCQARRLIAWGQ